MKRLTQFVLALILAVSYSISAQEFEFKTQTLQDVLQLSASQKKPVFIMLHASWCPHCKTMKKYIFPLAEVQNALNKSFVVSGFDADTPEGTALARRFQPTGYPAFYILNDQNELLYGFSGEKSKETLLQELEMSLQPDLQLPNLKKRALADQSNPELTLNYIQSLRKAGQPTQVEAENYLSKISDADLVTAAHWRMIANGITDISSREFLQVIKNPDAFAKVASEKRVKRKIEYQVGESLRMTSSTKNKGLYEKQRDLVKSFNRRDTDSLLFNSDRLFYEVTENWNQYVYITQEGLPKFASKDTHILKSVAEVYLNHVSDKSALNQAIIWSDDLLKLNETRDRYLLKAKLQNKAGDKKAAITTTNRAIEFCKFVGFDAKLAENLLEELSKS